MVGEFREFINRGSVVDLAVAFVMGAAVTRVVTAIVDRALMPAIAMVFGEPNFDQMLTFGPTVDGQQVGSLGAVLTALINFLLVALALFLIVRAYNRLQRVEPDQPEPEADPDDVVLLREIRDALVGGAADGAPGGQPSGGR